MSIMKSIQTDEAKALRPTKVAIKVAKAPIGIKKTKSAKSAKMVAAGKKAWRTRRKNQGKLTKSPRVKYSTRKNKFVFHLDDGEKITLPSNGSCLKSGKTILWRL